MLERTKEILARLIAFPTVSSQSNLALIDWAQDLLDQAEFTTTRISSSCGTKAGLLARFGAGDNAVLLSGHTDVVPTEGQSWTRDPFTMLEEGGRLYGRGSTDMKGFLACALALAETLKDNPPKRPVLLALSWDEEVGVRGIREMIGHVTPTLGHPALCIVGEPTSMRPATGHKGKASYIATCTGEPGHSSMAPHFTNALHLATDLVMAIRAEQARLLADGAQDDSFDPPASTIHIGTLHGGTALNIVPDHAELAFEIRHLAANRPADILARVTKDLPEGIEITETGAYPGLDADPTTPAIAEALTLLDDPTPTKVAYGTEAGYFASLQIPTVVIGPGTMSDGHQPDESIAVSELEKCLAFLTALTR